MDAGQDSGTGTGGGGTNGGTGGAGSGGASGGVGSGGATATGGSASGGHSASGGSGSGGLHGDGGVTGSGGAGAGGKAGGNGSGGKAGSSGTGGSSGGQTGAGGSGSGEFGFTYRSPSAMNMDWLCTFHGATKDKNGHVYVQLVQTGTKSVGIATVPVYGAELAQLSLDGTVAALANAQYDWGGGHHNDTLSFDYQGQTYTYNHSSFGFGFRSCQPMDCLSVYAPGATTPGADGCTSARTLPEVCVLIKAGGTHDPLVDRFMKCQGDTAK